MILIEQDAKPLLMERLDECLKVHADMLDAQNIGSIYELQGLSELHYYLKVEHVFTPAEVEALLSFQDPLDVARWCWEENNHEHSFPICDLLKEIDAEQKFEHFTSEASAQDKYTLLMKRLGQNYFAYRESLMSRDKESLIEKAAEITAMQEAYSYLTTKFEFGDEMLDDVLFLSWHGCKMRLRKCGNVRLRRNRYANSVHGNGPETILRWEVYRCLMYLYQRI